ncbi:MAG: PD40 domain-containing protein [Hormoscilla sp. GM102CHS1]|nr:PD40 domain-containing protein [Hormoscilla sp. GM102CHS1]
MPIGIKKPMGLQRQSNGQLITLDNRSELGAGGEARVFAVSGEPSLVAKVYRQPKQMHGHKLAAMLANPPDNPTASQGHMSFAWPVDLLLTTGTAQVRGFMMPRVTQMRLLIDFYNPKSRREKCPLFNYLYLHRTARNLAGAVGALHARGYCIGDVNESNILLTETALCTFVDMDSLQVPDRETGAVYRCRVGKPEFTPPELQGGKSFADFDRRPEQDMFGLAVLIFQLLMEGTHPFAGVYRLPGEPPPIEKRIAANHFPYGSRKVPFNPMPAAPPIELLHPTLRQLFMRCFEDGHSHPSVRPNAKTWQIALKEAEDSLVTCAKNEQHRYGNYLRSCPWCERTRILKGRDPFPSVAAVQSGQHLQPLKPKKIPIVPAPLQHLPAYPRVQAPVGYGQNSYKLPQPPPIAYTPTQLGRPRRMELKLPSVNPLVAGLFILALAGAGVWYGRNGGLPIFSIFRTVRGPIAHLLKSMPAGNNSPTASTGINIKVTHSIQYQAAAVQAIAFSKDGKILVSDKEDGTILLLGLEGMPKIKLIGALPGKSAVSAIAISPDGKILASASRSDDQIKLWQMDTGKLLDQIAANEGIVSLAIGPERKIIVTGSRDRTVKLWNLSNGTHKQTFKCNSWVNTVAISPDLQTLVAGTKSGNIHLVDLNALKEKQSLKNGSLPVESVAFTPDGKTLVSSHGREINLWNMATGQRESTMTEHIGEIKAIAISPDGKILASGGADKSIKIWDLHTSKLLTTLNNNESEVKAIAFSPDGKILASSSADGMIILWEI